MADKIKYFRADGNNQIGIGHIMRCLSIAKAFRTMGYTCVFIVADDSVIPLIEANNFAVICLNSKWNDLEQELDLLSDIIKKNNISTLVIDSYYVTEHYLNRLKKLTKTAYIDDVNSFLYPVDLLINYNLYSSIFGYEENYKLNGINASFALGSEFIPLREEFVSVKPRKEKTVKKLFITTGGTDNYNVAGNLLESFYNCDWFDKTEYDVIVGKFNSHKQALIDKWGAYKNVHLICDATNMADYMKECDIAVTAGGVTIYELMACGVPSVMYTLADNQQDAAKIMSKTGLIHYSGDVRCNMANVMNETIAEIERLRNNYPERCELSEKLQKTVDGKGSLRLAKKIAALTE